MERVNSRDEAISARFPEYVRSEWIPAYLADLGRDVETAGNAVIALDVTEVRFDENDGNKPYGVIKTVTGVVVAFEWVRQLPHDIIQLVLDDGIVRKCKPNHEIWVLARIVN